MTTSLAGIELETGGLLLKFLQTRAETGGALHAQEARYPAHSPLPPWHRHPRQEERFIVVEGGLKFWLGDGPERIVPAGQELVVPKGTHHRAHNPGDTGALVVWETRPALRTGEFFVAMERAARGRARPRLWDAAAILSEYREEFELTKPSRLVQRVVFGCLAPFGRAALQR